MTQYAPTCRKHKGQIVKLDKTTKQIYCPKCRINARRRAENAILQELCGTSVKAARADMGL